MSTLILCDGLPGSVYLEVVSSRVVTLIPRLKRQ